MIAILRDTIGVSSILNKIHYASIDSHAKKLETRDGGPTNPN